MRVSTAVTLALTALLVTSLFGVAVATPTAPASAQSSTVTPTLTHVQSSSDIDPKQVIRISLTDDGDATWSIESRILLVDDEDEAAFLEYADEVTNGQRDVSYDLAQFDAFREDAAQSTGREMSFENAGWDEPRIIPSEEAGMNDGSLPETDGETDVRVGVISYSFTWTNFATVDDGRIYFGDAMASFPALTDGQRLVVESPPGYALETPTRLSWDGPYQFDEDELEIVFVRSGGATLLTSGWLIGGVVVLVFAVGTGSYLLARRQPALDLPPAVERLAGRLSELGARLGLTALFARIRSRAIGDRERRRDATTADTDGGTAVHSHDGIDSGPASSGTELEFEERVDDDIDPELLSDEERVLRMLRQNGGRMKQASIVTETGWSNAKVSQLLSQMDEDDEIEKLRIGRENLITLPEVDPTKLE